MKAVKEEKKELKVTRGYSLSRENVMALKAEAFERTMADEAGTTSASEVLDEIVTDWRKRKALTEAGGTVVPVVVVKGRKK